MGNPQPPCLPFTSTVPCSNVYVTTPHDIATYLPTLLPGWQDLPPSNVLVSEISGGITNRLFQAAHPSATQPKVLVRIFGSEGVFSPADREAENIVFEQLANAGHAPALHAMFKNGRVEGLLPAVPICLDDMRAVAVMTAVARRLRQLHSFRPAGAAARPEAGLWAQAGRWAAVAADLEAAGALGALARPVQECAAALRVEEGLAQGAGVVFCHNDLLAGNILREAGDTLHLIDFEYAGWNPRAFDIANFFCEAMGGTDDAVVRPALYPPPAARAAFCRAYLAAGAPEPPREPDVRALAAQADRFAPLPHLYWGLWALVQSAHERPGGFAYASFAAQRLALYFEWAAARDARGGSAEKGV